MNINTESPQDIMRRIVLYIFIIFTIVFIFSLALDANTTTTTHINTEGKCYDKNSNLINGVTCVEEIKCGVVSKLLTHDYCYGVKQ